MIYKDRAALLIAVGDSIKMQLGAGILHPECKIGSDRHVERCSTLPYSVLNMNYEFPVAVLEDKPLYLLDTVYCTFSGDIPHKVSRIGPDGWVYSDDGASFSITYASWNPPKPKTVMIELQYEDAEYWVSYETDKQVIARTPTRYQIASENFYRSVKKALGKV